MSSPRKIFTLAAILATIGITSFLLMGTEFLPELDEGALWIRARFPQSMNLKKGTELAHQIRSVLKEQGEVRTVVSQLGGPEDGTDPNLFDNCEFFVDLKPKSEWSRFDHDKNKLIVGYRELLEEFYGIEFNVSQPIADNVEEAVSGVKGKNAVKIFGLDLAVLISLSQKIQTELKKIPGLVDVGTIASMPQVPHLSVRPNREKIAQLGLTSQDVNDLIEISVGGAPISNLALDEQRIDLIMRSPEAQRKSREDLQALPLLNSKGIRLRLDQVAQVEFDNDPLAIFREKMNRRIGVKFNIEGRDLGSAMKDVQKLIQSIELPPGYRIELGGESQSQKRAMQRLLVVIPLTLALLALLLFLTFQDLSVVGVCLFVLVLSVSGSLLLLLIRGIPFSVSSAVGLLALFGVVSLEVITLANTFLRQLEDEEKFKETILNVCSDRFRPIVMTSTLAALGLLPTAISHGIGSETQRPLATAVIGGLVTGIPCVLILLPCLLFLLGRWRNSPQAARP